MSSYAAITRYGSVRAAEYDTVFKPNPQRPTGKYGVVLLHGSGAPREFIAPELLGSSKIAPLIAQAGIPCISAEMSGQSWANDAAMTDIDNAIAFLAAQTGCPSTKVHLLGISMGGALMIRYAELHPAKVASMTGIIPLCNIQSIYAGQSAPVKAEMETAWGTPGGPLPAGANIHSNGASLTDIPAHFYYSTSDSVIAPADTAAFCTAYSIPLTNLGANGHSETSIQDAVNLGGTDTLASIIADLYANGA